MGSRRLRRVGRGLLRLEVLRRGRKTLLAGKWDGRRNGGEELFDLRELDIHRRRASLEIGTVNGDAVKDGKRSGNSIGIRCSH